MMAFVFMRNKNENGRDSFKLYSILMSLIHRYTIDKPPSGWEEPSPPTQRRNIPNYDDGTSLWAPSVRI